MKKISVDATCKIILNFLLWSVLATAFYFSKGFGTDWGARISEVFKGGIEQFTALTWAGSALVLIIILILVARGLRAKRSHKNELVGALVDEIGSVSASFGSVMFFAAATDWKLMVVCTVSWLIAWLLFVLAIKLGA
ncbi:hypothetical protein [Xanthomonas arboricola]|uniref:hypothetical protein n=1 Tax=Xanthomonas arboricola TaxID=56448 RepID=UPI000CEECF8D|nr:hypothetical protein [Xanthomonas arboricola]PPU15928.1 hypothetical protein XarbCFBP7610_21495 [Xanthomonas arboricola]